MVQSSYFLFESYYCLNGVNLMLRIYVFVEWMSNLAEISLWYIFNEANGCGIEMKAYIQCQLKPNLKNIWWNEFDEKLSVLNFLMKHIEHDLKSLAGFMFIL